MIKKTRNIAQKHGVKISVIFALIQPYFEKTYDKITKYHDPKFNEIEIKLKAHIHEDSVIRAVKSHRNYMWERKNNVSLKSNQNK